MKKYILYFGLFIVFTALPAAAFSQDFSGKNNETKVTAANAINIIKALFSDAKEGQWILTQAKKKYCVETTVIKKNDTELVLRNKNIVKGKLQSTTLQTVDLVNNRISKVTITDKDGQITDIPTENLLLNQISVTKFEKVKEGVKVKVPAGTFICDQYKAIADDKVVYFWLNDAIPVNKLVKAKIKHAVSKLKDYAGNPATS